MSEPPPALRLSATVLLLRDGAAGLEVFMVERHHKIDFVPGALVFPGGKVDPGDEGAAMHGLCDGIAGLSSDQVTVRVAAIRETFEEAGVLLARQPGCDARLDPGRLTGLAAAHRLDVQAGKTPLFDVLQRENLVLACEQLVPFAHWLTPEFMPKRFDTHFFLASAPPQQLAKHDGHESVESLWTTVEDAVEAERSGKHKIIFPTLLNLQKLGRSDSVGTALETARRDTIVTVLPEMRRDADGNKSIFIPPEAGYDVLSLSL